VPDQPTIGQGPVNIATLWFNGGFSVIPILPDGTKRPAVRWADHMTARMTPAEVEKWWAGGSDYGVAVVCGAISGNVEMLELEHAATDAESLFAIQQQCRLRAIEDVWDLLTASGYSEWTPSGGLHFLYRISDHEVPGNQKVARTPGPLINGSPMVNTLAETRGEGGYVIVAPTAGACHPSGESWETVAGVQGKVPTITWAQRMAIHSAVHAALDQMPEPVARVERPALPRSGELRPGDDFNERAEWEDILVPQGWTIFSRRGATTYWTRPGKDRRDGHSATTGRSPTGDRMYVFSSSAGLPTEEPMSKLYVHAHYHHGGDMIGAVRSLAAQGYGEQRTAIAVIDEDWSTGSAQLAPTVSGAIQGVESPGDVPPALFDRTETDVGNAQRLEAKAKGRFVFDHTSRRWLTFDGHTWRFEDSELIVELAQSIGQDIVAEGEAMFAAATNVQERRAAKRHRDYGMSSQSDGKIRSMVRQTACLRSMAATQDMLDQAEGLLNLPNGLLDLQSHTVGPNKPEHLLTMQFGATIDPAATCPKFEQFMVDAFPDVPTREYVQRALGYTLTGASNERTFFLLHGPSGTGKSTLTNLMARMFGDYGHTANETVFKQSQNESSTSLHELRKKRFVATSELPRDASLNENLLKRITGGDPINSRTLYQREQVWQPECVIFVATNFLPRISGDDDALWRRAKVIEMNTPFIGKGEVRDMADRLYREESSGILNWLLAGLKSYQERGLDEPESLLSATERYRNDADPVATFLTELVDEGVLVRAPAEIIPVSTVYELYRAYAHTNGQGQFSKQRITARLKALGHESFKQSGRQVYRGLGLRIQVNEFMLRL
jgi:putative DNA primase/helicase